MIVWYLNEVECPSPSQFCFIGGVWLLLLFSKRVSIWLRWLIVLVTVLVITVPVSVNDPYLELEIKPNATYRDIKKAYRRKSMKFFPDKQTDYAHSYKAVKRAYFILTASESEHHSLVSVAGLFHVLYSTTPDWDT
eukprot:TRINITY_DN13598_c0_g1_i1.p1 TRINITY_DN13598_c0_g1~~TRINITY_DN13598_c0_g1_i1.p1  ORF type:complete len:136 (+),score=16.03 TRINITY_DN13598_c0_g1_i1:52-459(+)